jgi:hypothetical protein
MLVCSLMLSCCAASSAIGGDAKTMLWDHLTFCDQFVIQHPDVAIVREPTRYCCRPGYRVHDCHFDGPDERYR